MSKKLSAQPLKESELREIECMKPKVKEKVVNCILTSYESKRLDVKSFNRNVCRLGHKVISIEIDENGIGVSLFLTNHVESMFVVYYEWSELKELVLSSRPK